MAVLFIIGRILLGAFFVYNAFKHFKHHVGYTGYAQSKGLPQARAMVIISGIALAIGGLSILTGFYIVLGMWLLTLFLIITTFTMHRFWKETDPAMRSMEIVQFTKNLAITGALLMLSSIIAIVG
jgi:putative oxidoreductase